MVSLLLSNIKDNTLHSSLIHCVTLDTFYSCPLSHSHLARLSASNNARVWIATLHLLTLSSPSSLTSPVLLYLFLLPRHRTHSYSSGSFTRPLKRKDKLDLPAGTGLWVSQVTWFHFAHIRSILLLSPLLLFPCSMCIFSFASSILPNIHRTRFYFFSLVRASLASSFMTAFRNALFITCHQWWLHAQADSPLSLSFSPATVNFYYCFSCIYSPLLFTLTRVTSLSRLECMINQPLCSLFFLLLLSPPSHAINRQHPPQLTHSLSNWHLLKQFQTQHVFCEPLFNNSSAESVHSFSNSLVSCETKWQSTWHQQFISPTPANTSSVDRFFIAWHCSPWTDSRLSLTSINQQRFRGKRNLRCIQEKLRRSVELCLFFSFILSCHSLESCSR